MDILEVHLSKGEVMTKQEALKIVNKAGEDFGWQMGKVGANYENGYMKAIRDVKQAFEHIVEANKMVVTNEEYIKNMNDKELARFLDCIGVCKLINVCRDKPCEKCVEKWLKEKVE